MKYSDIPIFLFLSFTLVYSVIGDPNNSIWSGLYFTMNYLIILLLLNNEKSKLNRVFGKSLCYSILFYVLCKFIFHFEYERVYTLITFIISLLGILIKGKK